MSDAPLSSTRFDALWRALGARGPSRDAFERLRAAYDEPHRAYHGARHIAACLGLLDDPEVRALARRPDEVEAALWFHDAIYDTHARDNEERSAALAEEHLGRAGVSPGAIARIAGHVRATSSHEVSARGGDDAGADAQLVIDVDLSILGAEPEAYARFEDEIRREYAWVDAALYAAGRTAVLQHLSKGPHVYGTDLFRARFEARARANLAAAIARLASPS